MKLAGDSNLPTGTVIGGRFEVQRLRGRGGMGSVYEAEDLTLSRPVALKLLSVASREAQARFATEAHAASRISSRYAAGIFDFGQDPDHGHYMVMELLDGTSLDEVLEERTLSASEATAVGADIAEALHAAHEAGVVHRDLKPGNVMLLEAGGVKVVDFGIARVMEPRGAHLPFETKPDVIIGTPAYMSPEAARGDEVGPPSDLYALGVLLFEMVTGEVPFSDPVAVTLLLKHLDEAPPRLAELHPNAEWPAGFDALVSALLEKDAAMRPRSAMEVAGMLRGMSAVEGPIRLSDHSSAARGAETAETAKPDWPDTSTKRLSGRWMLGFGLGAGALGLLIAAVALALLAPASSDNVVARPLPPDPARAELPAVEAVAGAIGAGEAPVEAEGADTPATRAQPTTVVLSLTVTPPSAAVTVDGEPVESDVILWAREPHVLVASAAGYQTERQVLRLDGDETLEIRLQRDSRARRGRRRGPSGPALPAKMREW